MSGTIAPFAISTEVIDELVTFINRKIAKWRGAAAEKSRPMTQNATPKRNQQHIQNLLEADGFNLRADHMVAYRDALVDQSLPPHLLGLARITEMAYEHLLFQKQFPSASWDQPIRTVLERCGITSESYATRREEFLSLKIGATTGSHSIDIKRREAAILPGSIPGFWPTPRPVIDRMLAAAELFEGAIILEPSAGRGDIADAIRARWADAVDLEVCEINRDLRDILEMKGYRFPDRIGEDFLNGGPFDQDRRYDCIIGNPPFERGQDMVHIRRAYDFLAADGLLVMLCSESSFFRNTKEAVQFRLWLSSVGAETEALPDDAFKQVGTKTLSRIVTIAK